MKLPWNESLKFGLQTKNLLEFRLERAVLLTVGEIKFWTIRFVGGSGLWPSNEFWLLIQKFSARYFHTPPTSLLTLWTWEASEHPVLRSTQELPQASEAEDVTRRHNLHSVFLKEDRLVSHWQKSAWSLTRSMNCAILIVLMGGVVI